MTDGTIPTVTVLDATGVSCRYARLSDVWSHRDRLAERILVPDLAGGLGIACHDAHHALRRLGLAPEKHPTGRQYYPTPVAADALRAENHRIALHRRSMKLAAAARQLKVAPSTAALLSRTGQLQVDPETDSSGARLVTRTSVEAYWFDHRRASARGGRGGVPVGEVARFTGTSEQAIMDLVHAGVLVQMPGSRRRTITAESLQAWLAGTGRS